MNDLRIDGYNHKYIIYILHADKSVFLVIAKD